MASPLPLPPKRTPSDTKRRIVTAAWELLILEGEKKDTFSARRVADMVGVTAGRVLQYYRTLDELTLDAFFQHYLPLITNVALGAKTNASTQSWREGLRANTRALMGIYFEHPEITRRAMAFAWRFDENATEQFLKFNEVLFSVMKDCVQDHQNPIPEPVLYLAARSWYRQLVQGVRMGFQMEWTLDQAVDDLWPDIELLADGIDANRRIAGPT